MGNREVLEQFTALAEQYPDREAVIAVRQGPRGVTDPGGFFEGWLADAALGTRYVLRDGCWCALPDSADEGETARVLREIFGPAYDQDELRSEPVVLLIAEPKHERGHSDA